MPWWTQAPGETPDNSIFGGDDDVVEVEAARHQPNGKVKETSEPHRFLFRSHWGECLPIALRVQAEGHEVQIFIGGQEAKTVGDGLIRKAVSFDRAVQWAEVIVYESNIHELPDEAERVRAVRPVIGSSKLAGRLENDRMFAISEARKAGLIISDPVQAFSGPNAWERARAFLERADHDQAFVWKPNGESPVQTYVSNNVPELVRMLAYWRDLFIKHHEEPSFVLTPKIEGVEISTEGWWDGTSFKFLNHTIECNRLMPGDIGEKTGCQGNVVWLAPQSRLAAAVIAPLKSLLGSAYRGPIDINAIIREEDNQPIFLEFTPRFGYDAIFGFMECVDDFGQLLYDCANGALVERDDSSLDIGNMFGASYRITIPPFPEEPSKENQTKAEGVPIFNLDINDKHFYLAECRLNGQDELETSGPDGFVMGVGGIGSDPASAMEAAYKKGEKICLPCMRWRNDLPQAIQEVYDDLIETGWLNLHENGSFNLFGRTN